jgi:hypothetical protein
MVSFDTSFMTNMMLTLLLEISGSLTPAAKVKSFVGARRSFATAQVKYYKNFTTCREARTIYSSRNVAGR